MHRRGTQRSFGRLLAILALVAYGSAGVLGYGLHGLAGCEHSAGCSHGHDHAGHEHHESAGGRMSVGADDSGCLICSFLAQGQTCFALKVELAGGEALRAKPQAGGAAVYLAPVDLPAARGPPIS
jgi:hypothetical protein